MVFDSFFFNLFSLPISLIRLPFLLFQMRNSYKNDFVFQHTHVFVSINYDSAIWPRMIVQWSEVPFMIMTNVKRKKREIGSTGQCILWIISSFSVCVASKHSIESQFFLWALSLNHFWLPLNVLSDGLFMFVCLTWNSMVFRQIIRFLPPQFTLSVLIVLHFFLPFIFFSLPAMKKSQFQKMFFSSCICLEMF